MFKKSKKGSRNGAGINLRHIRILYNNGIRKGVIPAEWYPFKRDSGRDYFEDAYTIPNERKVKVYLKEDELVIFAKKKTFNTEAQKVAHRRFLNQSYSRIWMLADPA